MSITLDDVKAVARAIAASNRHPDPMSYATQVVALFATQNPTSTTSTTTPGGTTVGVSAGVTTP